VTKSLAVVVLLAAVAAPAAAAPARLGVTATEFRFSLSRTTLRRGAVVIQLGNFGQDVHDLRLRRIGSTRVYGVPETKPGARRELALRLQPGRYRLWCSVADHRARGMWATLRVR
jgi:hypothetical protein